MMVFLFAIDLMGEAFNHLSKDVAESVLFATSNPYVGLFIGLLITALIQSSSTSTSMIVAIVASGSITIADAVPMIMGANIGTTLTSTIVSLGFINNRLQFRRAIAAGVFHDIFNILTVLILFPLEIYYGLLSNWSQQISGWFISPDDVVESSEYGFKFFEFIPITESLVNLIDNGFILIVLSFIMLFGSIKLLSKVISKLIIGESQTALSKYLFNNPLKSFLWGTIITGAVQSSSVTTSLVVPFVATNKIKIAKAAPFILGANIGTTITAFIAVLFKSNAAMSIAITHLLINLIGVLIFLPFPIVRQMAIMLAKAFGKLTMKYRLAGLFYIIFTFFIIPFFLIFFNRTETKILDLNYKTTLIDGATTSKNVIEKIYVGKHFDPVTPKLKKDDTPLVYQAYRRKNILFFNSTFFLINKPGYCWDDENVEGKFKMCIEEIIPAKQISNGQTLDSVYVYKKYFYNPKKVDSISYRYELSVPSFLLIKKEKLDAKGRVLLKEELTSFDQQ